MRLDFKMPSGLGFLPLSGKSPGSKFPLTLGIQQHNKAQVVSFNLEGLFYPLSVNLEIVPRAHDLNRLIPHLLCLPGETLQSLSMS